MGAGTPLAEIESLELRDLQAELLVTHARLANTSERVRRLESVGGRTAGPRKEFWELQKQQQSLDSRRHTLLHKAEVFGLARDQIDRLLGADLSRSDCQAAFAAAVPVLAPAEGWVAKFDLVAGQVVTAQMTLFEVSDPRKVWVKAFVPAQDVAHVRQGQTARVTFLAHPSVKGTIVRISPVLSSVQPVLPVWIELDNPDRTLLEGMTARVEIEANGDKLATTRQ